MSSTLCSRETLQNLPYFYHKKIQVRCIFNFSFRAALFFSLMNALVYVDIDQGIHCYIQFLCGMIFIFMFWHSYKACLHDFTWIWLCSRKKSKSLLELWVVNLIVFTWHSGPESLKKSRQKNSLNQINTNLFFVKLHFWQF